MWEKGRNNMKRLLQRESINIIKCCCNAFLGLSLNHQPYVEMIKYDYDCDNYCLQIIFNVNDKSEINRIIKSNSKAFIYLINGSYVINIKGKIYYSNEKNKLIFVCEDIDGFNA